jgi:hypothetical protein
MWCKNADDGQIRELLIISTQAKRRGQRCIAEIGWLTIPPAGGTSMPGGAVNALNICRPLMSDPEVASALIQCVGRVTRL